MLRPSDAPGGDDGGWARAAAADPELAWLLRAMALTKACMAAAAVWLADRLLLRAARPRPRGRTRRGGRDDGCGAGADVARRPCRPRRLALPRRRGAAARPRL